MRGLTRLLSCLSLVSCCAAAAWAQDTPETVSCLECHGVEGTRPEDEPADGVSLYLGSWEQSIHSAFECVDCHIGIEALPHAEDVPPADCSACHSDEVERYSTSVHHLRSAAGDQEAPSCKDCHDPHGIRPSSDPQSELHRSQLASLCIRCHADENGAGGRKTAVPHPAQSYARGAHARAMLAGNEGAATCSDCHDSHAVRRAQDPLSLVYQKNIPRTCGKCHVEEFQAFDGSIHSEAVELGATGAPACNSCHGEHAVINLGEPGATTVVASETCESCHNSPALARRYDLPEGAVASYEDSYHGLAARGGLARAAGCASCHGVHRILPASNPESSVHPDNRLATCRKCHPAATAAFAESYAHAPHAPTVGDTAAGWVRRIYLWLIGIVIGGMLLHNLVLFSHDLRKRFAEHKRTASHVRFTTNEVWQHFSLLSTFTLLVLTGFALEYPETFWARALASMGLDEPVRRIVHRTAGILMILASFYHLIYLFSTRGRDQIKHMLPHVTDAGEAVRNVAYHLGLSNQRPSFTRFRYIEKAEYWALIWGTIVMALTGLILWYPDRISGPSWLVRVAETIHLYEAWLAFLAIVVWHLFFVMLRPGTFPVSFTVITGKMEKEELEHEHPQEYEDVYGHRRLRRPPPGSSEKTETSPEDSDELSEPQDEEAESRS